MTTLTIQPDAAAGLDNLIHKHYPNDNYGALPVLNIGENDTRVDYVLRTLIKFDLSDLPADAIISSATLSLWCFEDLSSNARTFRVYRQKRAWIELESTWNKYDTDHNWQTAGGFGADDCEQTDIGSRYFTSTETLGEFKDFDLTPTTKAGLDLGNGWLIKVDTELNDQYRFDSSGGATAAQRPKLVIEYTLPSVGRSWGVIF